MTNILGYNRRIMTRNAFNEKGEVAEQLIAALCKDAFFEDFCFKTPITPKARNSVMCLPGNTLATPAKKTSKEC